MATQLNNWLSIDKTSGTSNAEITLTASYYKKLVEVISINPSTIVFNAEGGTATFTINSNTSWTISKLE